MTRRNLELILLAIAAPIVIILFAMYAVNENQPLSVNTLGVPLGIFAAFLFAHLAIRKLAPAADPAILPITFALSGIGIAFVTRLAPDLAVRQVEWLFAGIVAMVLVLVFIKRVDKVANYKYTLMIAGFLLLLSPMLPGIGTEVYGSRIWISLAGFSFQPGEIAKILIVLFLAGYLAANREMLSVFTWRIGPFHLPDIRTLMPMLIMWAISLVIVIFETDLGSALVFFSVFLVLLYVTTGKKSYIVVGILLAGIGAVALYSIFGHVQVRVATWLNPFADSSGTGYQLCQAIFSIADGNLFGTGIGRGMADQIPVVESDYIFAAIAEETGLLGAAGVLLLFLCFAVRGILTAARAKSDVSSFIATGLTATIVLQAFIIVGGVTRLIPLTGLTLPFISQGGSSLLASFISVGFLLRCGDQGTGVGAEMVSGTTKLSGLGVLGRTSLGKRLTHVFVVFALLFGALLANLTMIMIVQAQYYQDMSINNHTIMKEEETERGTISTSDGTVLAKSVEDSSTSIFKRVYPAGDLASHVVGYYSTRFGTSGIESTYNDVLSGNEKSYSSWTDVLNDLSGIKSSGNDVTLTINATIQQAAQNALSGYKGACVVINPKTGAVLAMASSPTYSASDVESILASGTDSDALYNRATQALYAPGSTFKMLSLSTALQNNVANESTTYSSPGSLTIGNGVVTNFDSSNYGTITLARATELSSNTVFAQVGDQIGANLLVSTAEQYGFNKTMTFDLPLVESLMPKASEMTDWETAWAACGQPVGEHQSPAGPQSSVLQMALIGCAIANNGVIESPYLVSSINNASGAVTYTASTTPYANVMSTSTAQRVRKVLEGVIKNGTGTSAAVSGVTIAGKTGTAQTGQALDNSWFVGMGPSDNADVVVAIVLEQSPEGLASSRSSTVMSTALKAQGDL